VTETPRPDQILRQTATIAALGERLHRNPNALLELTATMAGLIGSTTPGPRAKNTVSDPTAAQALTHDEVRRDLNRAYQAIDQATAALNILAAHWSTYMPSPKDIERRSKAIALLDELEACRTHRDAGLFMLAGDRYRDMCRRCGDFRHAHGIDPTPDLIRAIDSGRRLTPKLIALHCPDALKSA
jgi:hypothetical protein